MLVFIYFSSLEDENGLYGFMAVNMVLGLARRIFGYPSSLLDLHVAIWVVDSQANHISFHISFVICCGGARGGVFWGVFEEVVVLVIIW